jgi:hypothetical protein
LRGPEHSAARTTWELAFFEDDDCVGEVPVLELSPHTIPRYDCLDHFGKASSHSYAHRGRSFFFNCFFVVNERSFSVISDGTYSESRIALTDGRTTGMYMDEAEDIVEECGTSAQWQGLVAIALLVPGRTKRAVAPLSVCKIENVSDAYSCQ